MIFFPFSIVEDFDIKDLLEELSIPWFFAIIMYIICLIITSLYIFYVFNLSLAWKLPYWCVKLRISFHLFPFLEYHKYPSPHLSILIPKQ